MSDLISRADAIEAIMKHHDGELNQINYGLTLAKNEIQALPSADAKKKKAELKENGDWDCPDVGCDECDHHRSVSWCSLAIPNHEEIDETYKMVNEAFFEGFNAAEKQYRFLIETVEELDKKSADAVDCTDFIEWLVDRVLDETIWEKNSVAYGEIICRKLVKLGVLEVTEEPSYYICPSAEAVHGYAEWLEKIIVDSESFEWLCEDTPCKEWCDENCHYKSIQAECLRHLYEVSKGGDTE